MIALLRMKSHWTAARIARTRQKFLRLVFDCDFSTNVSKLWGIIRMAPALVKVGIP
jgi:hypothetical protein